MKISTLVSLFFMFNAVDASTSVHSYYGDDDYNDDNYGDLYHDYAEAQQRKLEAGKGGGVLWKIVAGGATGWFIGAKYHSGRVRKMLYAKHKKEQKELYTKYYNDIYQLQDVNAELAKRLKQRQ